MCPSLNRDAGDMFQVRFVRGDLVDEAGETDPEWTEFIRPARHIQEQNLEAITDLPGGQVPHIIVYVAIITFKARK